MFAQNDSSSLMQAKTVNELVNIYNSRERGNPVSFPREQKEKPTPWILCLTGSPIKNVGDKRRG